MNTSQEVENPIEFEDTRQNQAETNEQVGKHTRSFSDEYEKIDNFENPFKDTLAASEAIPKTTKLENIVIEDNYISKSSHQENLSKRKKKKQNLSLH